MEEHDQYKAIMSAWSSGVSSYHSLFSAYLTANSIFIAASILLAKSFLESQHNGALAIVCFSVALTGIFVAFQMAVALSRFSGQNSYFEWELRGMEAKDSFKGISTFTNLYNWREKQESILITGHTPSSFEPNWAVKIHRYKYAARSKAIPFVFGGFHLVILVVVTYSYLSCV
jgi:hypothetical protein